MSADNFGVIGKKDNKWCLWFGFESDELTNEEIMEEKEPFKCFDSYEDCIKHCEDEYFEYGYTVAEDFWSMGIEEQRNMLLKIVNRLPETADHVRVIPSVDSVWHPQWDEPCVVQGDGTAMRSSAMSYGELVRSGTVLVSNCYSSLELAKKAKENLL